MDRQSKIKSLAKGSCGIILLVAVVTLLLTVSRNSSDKITFRLIDRNSRRSVTNVVVESFEQWIGLPLEKLRLPGIKSWRNTRHPSQDGSATISIPRRKDFSVSFRSPGYGEAEFVQQSGSAWIHYRGGDAIRQTTRTNALSIELNPEIQGPGPFDINFCIQSLIVDDAQAKGTNDNRLR